MIMIIIIDFERRSRMEKCLKKSKQRDAILNLLKSVKCHPTAEWIYTSLKPDFPSISLATVYRNLNLLCELGEAIKIEVGDGTVRFDGDVKDHYHFLCTSCKEVTDINGGRFDIDSDIESRHNVKVDYHSVVFYGSCGKCRS